MATNTQFSGYTFWDDLIVYINEQDVDTVFSRQRLIQLMHEKGHVSTYADGQKVCNTLDTYRNYLTKAGFLKISQRGQYKKIKQIPITLSIQDAKRIAYKKAEQI